MEELLEFADEYRGSSEALKAIERIEALTQMVDWVLRQDKLATYRRHLELVPNSPQRQKIERRIIDLEVEEILAGDHGVLPPASLQNLTGGATALVELENQTQYVLTVRYSGRESQKFRLLPRQKTTVSIASGVYRVAASVDAGNVTPYAGSDSLSGGEYSVSFFIETRLGY